MTGHDFLRDLRDEVVANLPVHDAEARQVVAQMSPHDLCVWLFNWLNRFVLPGPRIIFRPRELARSPLFIERRDDVEALLTKIEQGSDLTAHLSKRIGHGFTLSERLNSRPELDLMLNEWGIHHLHLTANRSGDDNPLLYMIFTERAAFVLDVLAHGVWADQRLVEVAIRNWPEAGLFRRLPSVLPGKPGMTTEGRRRIRNIGMTSGIEIGDHVYVSRTFGITTGGTATGNDHRARRLLRRIHEVSKALAEDPDYLRPWVEKAGALYPLAPSFRLQLIRTPSRFTFGIVEKTTGATVAL